MAIVVDDRRDVWDAASQQAILNVIPYHHYKYASAVLTLGPLSILQEARDSDKEMKRVKEELNRIRGVLYWDINQVRRVI